MSKLGVVFRETYMRDSRSFTHMSFVAGAVTYGCLWLFTWGFIVPSDDNIPETSGFIGFWVWAAFGLFAGNLVGVFVFERVRVFAVFAYLSGVAIFPSAFFLICLMNQESVVWYWQQLGWIVGLTAVTVVWQVVYGVFIRDRVSSANVRLNLLWMPVGVFMAIFFVMFFLGAEHSLSGGLTTRPGMEWAMSMGIVMLGGALGWVIVMKQFFRLVSFVGGGRGASGGGGRYGRVFDGFGPGGGPGDLKPDGPKRGGLPGSAAGG